MLKIKGQIKLKSLRGISLTPNILYDRIGVYYRIMNLQISAEDFFHLLNRPPELYLAEGEVFHLTVNNDTGNQYLKLEFINQMLNRLLLLENQSLSYQDSVFVTAMLKKTGIIQIGELLKDIRQSLKENQTINKLTDLYQYNGTVIRKLVRAGEKESVSIVQKNYEQQYGRHSGTAGYHYQQEACYAFSSAVYQRLQTEEIYNQVYERNRQYGFAMQTVNHQELNMAEQVRASGNLLLSRLRKAYTFRETGGTEIYINPYEAGAGNETRVTRETVLSEILSAVVLSLVNNISRIRREQMEQQVYPQYRIVQSLYHSMENVLNRYELFHTQETWKTAEIYPFMEDNRTLWDSEINLLEEMVRKEAVLQFSNETIHSARWQQALIHGLSRSEEYNLSETVWNTFMEYSQTENQFSETNVKVIQNPVFFDKESDYQNIIDALQHKTDEYFSEEKQEIITEIVCELVNSTIKTLSAQTSEQQSTLVKELSEVREISKVIKEIGSTGYTYGYPQLADEKSSMAFREFGNIVNLNHNNADKYEKNVVSESHRLRQKLNLTYSVVHQWFNDEKAEIMISGLKAGDSESDKQIVFRRDSDIHVKEKTVRELRQIIQKEKSIRNIFRQDNEYHQEYHENKTEISRQLSENEEIQNQWQNQEMLRQLQEINQKNIEINQKYRQELQQRNTSVSHLQADGRKTIKETLKVIQNPQNESVESIELIQKNPKPPAIDEAVRKLASRETIEILESILGRKSENPEKAPDGVLQKSLDDSGNEGKQSIKIHRKPEAELQWEIREIERQMKGQMERQTKQQYSVMETWKSFMPPAGMREEIQAAGESPGLPQNPLQAVTLIHKEQNTLTEEALLPYLRQYRQPKGKEKNDFNGMVVNRRTETKEISRKINQTQSQSKEEVEELVRRNLQRQMETITDRVFNRIEKKLQMERRRRGY
ncbi:MAG: hypothetical protein HFI34_11120 [Lachnospiraceae bacterium]|nr:hypothetical protein [Lachnospiraceae bacterium]